MPARASAAPLQGGCKSHFGTAALQYTSSLQEAEWREQLSRGWHHNHCSCQSGWRQLVDLKRHRKVPETSVGNSAPQQTIGLEGYSCFCHDWHSLSRVNKSLLASLYKSGAYGYQRQFCSPPLHLVGAAEPKGMYISKMNMLNQIMLYLQQQFRIFQKTLIALALI